MGDWTSWAVWIALGLIFGYGALCIVEGKARWLACIAIVIVCTAYGLTQ